MKSVFWVLTAAALASAAMATGLSRAQDGGAAEDARGAASAQAASETMRAAF